MLIKIKIQFNKRQLDKLSDIFSDIALVSLASIALPAIFDKLDPARVVLGISLTVFFWISSLFVRSK